MTDQPPVDDELASALVDGEATAAEQARPAADARLAARVEQLRAVRAIVGTAPTAAPSPEARERAISAALALAASQDPAATGGTPPPPPPTDLAAHRSRRRPWLPAAAAAAVALLLGVGAFAALGGRDQGGGEDVATLAGDGTTDAAPASERAGDTALAEGGATTTAGGATSLAGADAGGAAPTQGSGSPTSTAGLPHLGAISDEAALVAALEVVRTTTESSPAPAVVPSTIAASDDQPAPACPSPDGVIVAMVVWQEQPAFVAIGGDPEVATVLSEQDCTVLAQIRL